MDKEYKSVDDIEFPCYMQNGKLTTFNKCQDCPRSDKCDVYATMLDEDFD